MNFRQRRFRYGLMLGAAFLIGVGSGPTIGVLGRAVAQGQSRAEARQVLKVLGLSMNDAVDRMRGAPTSRIMLTIKREGSDKPLEIGVMREIIKIQVVKSRMEADNIGYVRLSQFTEKADAGVRSAVKSLKTQ